MTGLKCPPFESVEPTPAVSPALLSRQERERILERGFRGLYRWYVSRSQAARNWNADRSFNWAALRQDHSVNLRTILQGFYAVEQFAPDYTVELTRLTRRSYGRSHFQMRWGAEEEKHADLWRNALLFSGHRSPAWLEQYTLELRERAWQAPWDDPLRMLLYTVFQERATQVTYLNTAAIARGANPWPAFANDADSVLAKAAAVIAADEAAHYDFFLEGARLYLYYFPEETLTALADVLRHFAMPAMALIPDYGAFVRELYDGEVYGKRQYARDVVRPALNKLGVVNLRRVEAGIRRGRTPPGGAQPAGADASPQSGQSETGANSVGHSVEFPVLESAVRRLFIRLAESEAKSGLAAVDPTTFVRHSWSTLVGDGGGPKGDGFNVGAPWRVG
jgi:acyl-[acyl-carrier-protein] desaturase